ncbi:amino acid adenylation domain-containing protein [Herbidospora sp. RD11066]
MTHDTAAEKRRELLRRRLAGARGTSARLPLADRSGPLPLSPAQRRLWFLDRLEPDGVAYVVPLVLRFADRVPAARLRECLSELAARHEALRTRFVPGDDEPRQVVDAPSTVKLTVLTAAPEEVDGVVADLVWRPFDLAGGPVWRAALVEVEGGGCVVVLAVHHIACDGISLEIISRELLALLAGGELPPRPRVQYADVAAWQASRPAAGPELDYWRERLADLSPLEVPTDRPRPAVRGTAGGMALFGVPAEVAESVAAYGRSRGATPYMTLLAAWALLLGRHAGRLDVAVGTPVAGRNTPEVADVVGCFVNMLVMRLDLTGNPTFGDLLDRVRQTALGAFAHQDVPFERLAADLEPGRDLTRNPLFQHVFAYEEDPEGEPAPVEVLPLASVSAKFDLQLTLRRQSDGALTGVVEYATDLFDHPTAEAMATRLTRLLAAIAATPCARIADLPILTPADRATLLTWSTGGPEPDGHAVPPEPDTVPTSIPGAAESDDRTHDIVARFERQARSRPNRIALVAGSERLTYAGLNARADALAHRLRAEGAGPEVRVGVRLPRGADLVTALLAVAKSGAAYVPLDPGHPEARLAGIAEDAGIVITLDLVRPEVRLARMDVNAGAVLDPARPKARPTPIAGISITVETPGTAPATEPTVDRLAYVIYTSGSTGRPKGVEVAHRNLGRLVTADRDRFGFGPDDVWAMCHSPAFDFSVWEMWGALAHGGRLVVVPHDVARDPEALATLVAEQGVTVLNQTPTAFAGLQVAMPVPPPALRMVVFGGERLDAATLPHWPGVELVNMYGITETTVHVTRRVVTPADVGSPIGRPLDDMRTYVVDVFGDLAPPGVIGELYVGGAGVARGYLGRPALTADRFTPDPYTAGKRVYRSGDLARWTPDGELRFAGRADQQVKIRGYRIEPGEVRAALIAHPEVADAAVIAREDTPGHRRLVAYVVSGTDPEELRAHLRHVLPPYMVPSAIETVAGLPLTSTGKLDIAALPAPGAARRSAAEPPVTATERRMTTVWERVLGQRVVGVGDDFFELGGDSVRAVALVGALRAEGFDVAVRDVFEDRTVAALAVRAAGRTAAAPHVSVAPFALLEPGEAAPVGVVDAYPLSRIQAGMVYEMLADAERGSYHNVTSFSITDDAPLDETALRRAADLLVARHEVLRTSIDLAGADRPLQRVHATAVMPVHVGSLNGDDELTAFLDAERATPFDLLVPPLLRLAAHRTGSRTWRLSLTECHAILEGWSYHSLLMELLTLYRAVRDGREVPAADPPPVRYADFVAAELATVADPEARDYWREVVDGHSTLALPAAWRDPEGGRAPYKISIPLFGQDAGLRRLASAAGVPLKSVLLAAHLKVMSGLTHERAFHTGLVCDTRPEVDGADRLAGMFINTVPFPHAPSAADWRGLVREVFAAETAMWPHRRFPLPETQQRFAGGRQLVEVYFNYLDFTVVDTDLVDLTGSVDVSPNEFPLSVTVLAGLLTLTSSPDVLARDQAERLAAWYEAVLDAMAADPCGDALASYLAPGEKERLLQGPPELPRPPVTVLEVFEETARLLPGAEAVTTWDGRSLTYAELDARANRIAHALRAHGAGPETVVGLCLERGPDLVAGMLGAWKAGAAYTPLEPAHPADRWGNVLADAGALVTLADPEHATALASVFEGTVLTAKTWEDAPSTRPPGAPDLEGLAYIMYTSGSTGRPKGVLIGHRGLANYLWWGVERYAAHGVGGAPLFSSVAFDMVVPNIFVPLMLGQRVHLLPPRVEPGELGGLLADGGPYSFVKLTPGHVELLTHQLDADRAAALTELLAIGADAFPTGILDRWQAVGGDTRTLNEYGPTEISVANSTYAIDGPVPGEVVPIGVPIPNTTMYVLDRQLEPVASGVVGEIYIGGAGVARGYHAMPGRTAERFVPDPYGVPGDRLYRTGDLASVRDNGDVDFLGRADDQIKIRGYRIEPGEVQAVLTAHPGVHEAIVLARDERLVAYWVPTEAGTDEVTLLDWCRERLPDYLVPAHAIAIAAVPLNSNGKVDRKALPLPGSAGERVSVAPRTEVERRVAEVWAGLLGAEPGVTDDFFALGGHSIMVVRMVSRLREAFGVSLPMRAVFDRPTVEGVARLVAEASGPQPIPATPRTGPVSLSAAQRRLWMLDRLNPGSPEYLVPMAVRLRGVLDPARVREAWERLVARHEILRTRYAVVDGEPRQIVDPAGPIDFTATTGSEESALAVARQPFDLAAEWPIRVRLIELGPDDHLLVAVLHHIACDGWSTGVLQREFTALYLGDDPGPAPVQYADYAAWVTEGPLGYWREHLAGLEPLPLATDRPRPAIRDWAGDTVTFAVPDEVGERLREIARAHGTTMFVTTLAAAQMVLARQTGALDVPLGTPVAGRDHPDLAGMVGCTVNTLLIRGDLRGDPAFTDVLRLAKETVAGALAHQDVPFETLVEALSPDRDLSRNPLFDVMFALDHVDRPQGEPVVLDGAVAKFDLTLHLDDHGDTLTGLLEFATALFDRTTAERLTARFLQALAEIAADPSIRLSRLAIPVAPAGLRKAAQVEAAMWETTPEAIAAQVAAAPDAVAVIAPDGTAISYKELDLMARRVAGHLRAEGAGPEDVVGVCLGRGPHLLAALLGVWYAGAAYLPLDPSWPPLRRAALVEDMRVRIVLDEQVEGPEIEPVRVDPDTLAYVIATSGSTGRPKGVAVSHRSLAAYLRDAAPRYDAARGSAVLTSPAYDLAVTTLFAPLVAGGRVRLLPADLDLASLGRLLTQGGPYGFVKLTPGHLEALLASPSGDLPEAGHVVVGGETLTSALAARWPKIINEYGPTEATVACTIHAAGAEQGPRVPVGKTIAGASVRVLDLWLDPCAPGTPGEVMIGGPGVARGYHGRPALTADRFVPDPYGPPGSRMYRTGDLGRVLDTGDLDLIGRTDDQVKIRGHRVEPGEVAATLAESVKDAVVVAREGRLVAYVVPAEEGFDEDALIGRLRERLPAPLVPWRVIPVAAIPLTHGGKTDLRALPAPAAAVTRTPPGTAAERLLAGIWGDLLETAEFGVHDDFFRLGGHSILAVRLLARVQEVFEVELAFRTVFEHPSVAGLARAVEEAIRAEVAGLTDAEVAVEAQRQKGSTP